jgi:hypothetical protein
MTLVSIGDRVFALMTRFGESWICIQEWSHMHAAAAQRDMYNRRRVRSCCITQNPSEFDLAYTCCYKCEITLFNIQPNLCA